MKILIVSDTHRYLGNLQTALEEEGPVDMLIHLGDIEHQMADVIRMARMSGTYDCRGIMIFSVTCRKRKNLKSVAITYGLRMGIDMA